MHTASQWRPEGCAAYLPKFDGCEGGPESLVGRFPQAVSGQVEWDSQVFVLVNGGLEPLFTVLGVKVVGEKWNGEWDVRFWRTQVAVFERLMNNVESRLAAMRRIA